MTIESDAPVLKLENISVTFHSNKRRFHALSDFSFHMQRGEVTVVVGDSGSGKSTLLHYIAGLLAPRSHRRFRFGVPLGYINCEQADGCVIVGGRNITECEPRERAVGLIPQQYSLYDHMTVGDNLIFPLKLCGEYSKMAQERVNSMADKLHIEDLLKQRLNSLSGGQLQRVSLGKLLLQNPVLALLDESFAHIDPLIEDEIIDILTERLKDDGASLKGIVIVTHDLLQTVRANRIILFCLPQTEKGETTIRSRAVSFAKNGTQSALDAMKANGDQFFEKWRKLVMPIGSQGSQ